MIKRTKPEIVVPKTPQCQYKCKGYWPPGFDGTVKKDGTKQCSLGSSYEIDGKHFCGTHAGKIALKILMKEPYDSDVVDS